MSKASYTGEVHPKDNVPAEDQIEALVLFGQRETRDWSGGSPAGCGVPPECNWFLQS